MIEIKLSQGAKPSHGGILPANKITPVIADARGLGPPPWSGCSSPPVMPRRRWTHHSGLPCRSDCNSPPRHSAFSSPAGLMKFVAQLRELSGGKPIGATLLAEMWPPSRTPRAAQLSSPQAAWTRAAAAAARLTRTCCHHDRLQDVRRPTRGVCGALPRDDRQRHRPRLHHHRWRRGWDRRGAGRVPRQSRHAGARRAEVHQLDAHRLQLARPGQAHRRGQGPPPRRPCGRFALRARSASRVAAARCTRALRSCACWRRARAPRRCRPARVRAVTPGPPPRTQAPTCATRRAR